MEITDDTFTVVLQKGENKSDFYGMVTEVVDEFPSNEKIFVARLSKSEIKILNNDERVLGVDHMATLKSLRVDDADNTLPAKRMGLTLAPTSANMGGTGNWCLRRHTSAINNFAATNTNNDMDFSYPQHDGVDVDGTGVDIVFFTNGMIDTDNAGYETGGVSRIQEYQWNDLPGLSSMETINYSAATYNHAEKVIALACHNTYGWAKGAKIYIIPRNQIWNYNHEFEACRLFHKSKVDAGGTVRPTIASNSWGTKFSVGGRYPKNINFRGTIYSSYRGESLLTRSREYMPYEAVGLQITYKDPGIYVSYTTLVNDLQDEGVFSVWSAGNEGAKYDVPGGIDYDNYWLESTNTDWGGIPAGTKLYYNRGAGSWAEHSIVVANMSSAFDEAVTGEYLWGSSSRGPRVDCAMGGTLITTSKPSGSGFDYNNNGTSFSAPQVAGILAMVLQKYPSTTQAQARKYFREHAIGADKLYDSGVAPISDGGDHGDPEYFNKLLDLQSYSGNILYFDPAMAFDPSGITDTTITYPTETMGTSRLNYTVDQINAILAKAD